MTFFLSGVSHQFKIFVSLFSLRPDSYRDCVKSYDACCICLFSLKKMIK